MRYWSWRHQFSAGPKRISQFTDLLKQIAIIVIIANIAIYAVLCNDYSCCQSRLSSQDDSSWSFGLHFSLCGHYPCSPDCPFLAASTWGSKTTKDGSKNSFLFKNKKKTPNKLLLLLVHCVQGTWVIGPTVWTLNLPTQCIYPTFLQLELKMKCKCYV